MTAIAGMHDSSLSGTSRTRSAAVGKTLTQHGPAHDAVPISRRRREDLSTRRPGGRACRPKKRAAARAPPPGSGVLSMGGACIEHAGPTPRLARAPARVPDSPSVVYWPRTLMRRHVAAITGSDGQQPRRPLAPDARKKPATPVRLTPTQAVALWYRMGMTAAHLHPPARYRHAYELGRKTAALRDPTAAAFRPGRAG